MSRKNGVSKFTLVILLGLLFVFGKAFYAYGGIGLNYKVPYANYPNNFKVVFDLILSIRYNASPADIQKWKDAFSQASNLLFNATHGQMAFGTIKVLNNRQNYIDRDADAFLFNTPGTSYSPLARDCGGKPCLETRGKHMALMYDEISRPYVILHEFGHYGLGLYEEYNYNPPATQNQKCTGNVKIGACIMEFGYAYANRVTQFCTDHNHGLNNQQQQINLQSCWGTICKNYGITPPEGLPANFAPAFQAPVFQP